MTDDVQQPPILDINAHESLLDSLDDLLSRYLILLDQYTEAREQLSSDLASGFIALAQANFNNPNRVRYGQDLYDERMQALRKVTTDETGPTLKKSIALIQTTESPSPDHAAAPKNEDEAESKPSTTADPTPAETSTNTSDDKPAQANSQQGREEAQPSPTTTFPNKIDDSKNETEREKEKDDSASQKEHRPRDPIRMFGILVPPALRTSQAAFIRAIEGPVPRLANLAAELRALEIEIGRARKTIRKSGDSGRAEA